MRFIYIAQYCLLNTTMLIFWFLFVTFCTKVHSFLKQCLHDLHFMKTRSFHQILISKLAQLASAGRPCFHKMKNTVSKMNGFYDSTSWRSVLATLKESIHLSWARKPDNSSNLLCTNYSAKLGFNTFQSDWLHGKVQISWAQCAEAGCY